LGFEGLSNIISWWMGGGWGWAKTAHDASVGAQYSHRTAVKIVSSP